MAFFYILYSQKLGRYYIGSTDDIERRISEHNRGQTISTRNGVPWELKFRLEVESIDQAKQLEMKVKRWKSRKLIEQVIIDQRLRIEYSAPMYIGEVIGSSPIGSKIKNPVQKMGFLNF